VDFKAREVKTTHGAYFYDYLVVASGSRTAYFNIPGAWSTPWTSRACATLYGFATAVIDSFEEAVRLGNEAPEGLLTFVFVGGGPTGVEAAADTKDLIFDVLEGDYPNVDFDRVRLVLVNSGERIVGGMDFSCPTMRSAGSPPRG
jgi:NADH dehydrogenase